MDNKKLAAAIAAVFTYIKTGEEAAAQIQEPIGMDTRDQPAPALQMNTWGMVGRQSLMQASTMMQMRMFK